MEYKGAYADSRLFWEYLVKVQGEYKVSWDTFAIVFETYLRENYPRQVDECHTNLPLERILRYAFGRGATEPSANGGRPVGRQELELFLHRFGPLDVCLAKAGGSLFEDGGCLELWFHGYLTRKEAEGLLEQDGQPGAFLVRFSESQV
ncbi:unnamed protein product [Choristocarpus tenellus]